MPTDYGYFHAHDYQDKLTPGKEIHIQHGVKYYSWNADKSNLARLVLKSEDELEAMRASSVNLETGIYHSLKKEAAKWEEQAGETLLLERALEYVRTPEVKHTENQWKQLENGDWEISNRVYIMRYRISKADFPDKKTGKNIDGYRVDWALAFNTPEQPPSNEYGNPGDSRYITRQDKKLYATLEAAQNYIQGRFDLQAHLFTEISPPIPHDCRRMFTVNGHLLPGYTVQEREKSREETVNDLLSCLEDEEASGDAPEQEAPEPPALEKAESAPARPAPKKQPRRHPAPNNRRVSMAR